MLNSTFGLSKNFLQFLDKENSYQNQDEDTYTLIFITGEKEVFKKVGIKKAVMNYIDLHKESLENALNQAERLQANENNTDEAEENESNQVVSNQSSTEIALFNNIPVARLQKFFTLENIGILEKLIENEKSGVLVDHSSIPDHYRKLSNGKSVSIRMNEEIYNKMKLYSVEIGETMATITNYLFDMYLKEMKK